MSRYFLSLVAERDLEEINAYIASYDLSAANRFLKEIAQKFQLLANFPNIGRLWNDLNPPLRSFPVGKYLIFYRYNEDGVEIMRIVSGYRDIDALFQEQINQAGEI